MASEIETDYLIVGAGAMGMAFADTLVAETGARVAIVDRRHQPGGHWTIAYPFVRLHQPSTGYGVNSRVLGSDAIDRTGWNAGLYELATAGEVCAYFDQLMQQTLLPTDRVSYHPMCLYEGDGRVRSLVSGEAFTVKARKIVDSTYQHVTVPAMRRADYAVAEGVRCVPVNALADLHEPCGRFTIIGGGKTGMDACLWLLRQGVDPDRLTWVRPRDAWFFDRARLQPGPLFAETIGAGFAAQAQAIQQATSIDDMFERLEACGQLIRLDPTVRPTMWRCATVSQAELEQLRRIKDVVRLGRVRQIQAEALILDQGRVPAAPDTLYVDCSADGLERRPPAPVFDGERITLQSVRTCQQVFSAAFIAHVEAAYPDEATKNDLCVPIPHPDAVRDFLSNAIQNGRNEARWSEDAALRTWLAASRLNWLARVGPAPPEDPEVRDRMTRMAREGGKAAAAKLQALLDV